MSTLPRTPIHRHLVMVHGTALGRDLRNRLASVGYTPFTVAEIVEHIGAKGTATGSLAAPEDVGPLNHMIMEATGNVESDPAVWGGVWDDDRYAPTDLDPEPSAEDLRWAEAKLNIVAELPTLCGGAPTPDEKPIKVRPWDDQTGVRSRVVEGWTDADQLRVGSVG